MLNGNKEKVLHAIRKAGDAARLREIRETEQSALAAAIDSAPVDTVMKSLGELHDALIVRTLELAETEMARLGFGAPPVPYAYMLFGSGGRCELTFASDQDSGIVYGNPASDAEKASCAIYFSRFAKLAVSLLSELDYPPCEGNVVASNPKWCLPLREWEAKIDGWFADPSWENVRHLLILADGRAVSGDRKVADRLKDRFFTDMLQSPVILRRMLENTLRHKVLVGVFGQLLRERYGENAGSLDIKYGAYIPLVNLLRLLAVQAGIRETGSLERIAALRDADRLTPADADDANAAFTLALELRLLASARQEGGRWAGSGKIAKEHLTKDLALRLKKTLKWGKKMQRDVQRQWQDRFGGGEYE